MNEKQNIYSHLTAKERDKISYPARIIIERNLLKGNILDYGCGFGSDVKFIKEEGYNIIGYDPYYYPDRPQEKFDTIICFYVLNVLLPEEQAKVLMDISTLLKPGGKAYFAVRRDIKQKGFRIHKLYKKPTYQCIVKLPYKTIFKNKYAEIYEYQHYTMLHKGNGNISPFLQEDEYKELVAESAIAFSIYDKYPVNQGHVLVIPKRKVSNYFDLTFKEQNACNLMINFVQSILSSKYNLDGFNIGINIGWAAGQTVEHVHLHVIPRYKNDIDDPTGGVRNAIPSKGNYLKNS